MNLETHCKGCVFAKSIDIGNSCDLGRLEKFKATEIIDGYYKFERYCNSKRDSKWVDGLDYKNPVEEVVWETSIRMGLVINFCANHDLQSLDFTLLSSFSQSNKLNPTYVIVINDKPEYHKEIYDMINKYIKDQSRIHIVQILDVEEEFYIDEAFRFARAGYITYCNCGDFLPKNYIDKINKYINIDMNFFSLCVSMDGRMIFQNTLFKLLNGNKPKLHDDGTCDTDPFAEKVVKLDGVAKCVHLWNDFFYDK